MTQEERRQLLQAANRDPVYERLLRHVSGHERRSVNIIGPGDAQKNYLVAALADQSGRRPVLVVPDELRARSCVADLATLTDAPVLAFRPRELNFTDADAASRDLELQRLAVLCDLLTADTGVIVVTASALLQRLPPRARFSERLLRLNRGDRIDPEKLCASLVRLGYERMRLVEAPGQFAQRGDIIDIVPPSADSTAKSGIRLSFFDVELDSVKDFDLDSQRSIGMRSGAVIPPAREILIAAEERDGLADRIRLAGQEAARQAAANGETREYAETIRVMTRRDAERVGSGVSVPSIDRYLELVEPEAQSLLSYLDPGRHLLFIEEPLRFRNRLDAAAADFDERLRTMLTHGHVLPLTAQSQLRTNDIGRLVDQYPRTMALSQIAASGNGLPGAMELTINGRAADSFRGQEAKLADVLRQRLRDGLASVAFAGSDSRRERLRAYLLDQGADIAIFSDVLPRGFEYPAASLLAVGSHDLFGTERAHRRRQHAGIKIDLFSDLVPGELVVHEAHGIGRYEGLANLETNGIRRDYLKISYAGSDSLYIPMESLDQIQKYVGSEGKEPKLSKLGGQEWTRMKERARESIRKLATDLVRLYAERAAVKGHTFAPDTIWQQEFEERFPYDETEDQLRSIAEIKADMESDKVMDRLLCGDVGFGKTEVAFRAMFKCVMDGRQAALLSPTTVLAQQHFENLKKRLEGFPVNIGLLSRFASEAMQKNTVRGLTTGRVDIAVGTHRLLSQDVHFKNIGLLVVDEEQRFGVDHKELIKSVSPNVDVLTLTATPIPRTLHMSLSGIRDISVLEEPPHDRRPVQTYVMEYDQEVIAEAILRELTRNGQVFYLYNDTRRIIDKARQLEMMLPGARILHAHGKMSERRLEEIITAFIEGEADVLVCTTIIESGIDMPNVNTIIVEEADRLGLAQLYQLRGRVGRSDRQAFAYITYRRDKILSEVAEKRLAAIRDFTELGSGFKIAMRDLEVRGAGNLLGAEQHGHLDAIGYDLYTRMLEETIREMKGEPQAVKVTATVDLPVDAFLSPAYIPDEGQRMDFYRRIAGIGSYRDYTDVLDELMDRYGELPDRAITLADIAYVRAAAERNGFGRVSEHEGHVRLAYAEGVTPDMAVLADILALPAYKGMLLFSAGAKPYVTYRAAARDRRRTPELLRNLFRTIEENRAAKAS